MLLNFLYYVCVAYNWLCTSCWVCCCSWDFYCMSRGYASQNIAIGPRIYNHMPDVGLPRW